MKFPASIIITALLVWSASTQAAVVKTDAGKSEVMAYVHATGHTMECYLSSYQIDIEVDPASAALSSAEFSFNTAALTTEHEKRDHKMHTWIESDKIPKAVFTLQSVREGPEGKVAVGVFKMHGVEQVIEMPYTCEVDGDQVTLKSSFTLDYTRWNLDIIRMMFMKVHPELDVEIVLKGTLVSE